MAESAPSSNRDSSADESLLRRVKARDNEAWNRLTDLYGPLVYHWGRRYGLSSEDAADALQETFVAVSRGIAGFELRGPGSFRGWLWTIARRKILDCQRRAAQQEPGPGGSSALRRLTDIPEQPLEVTQDEEESAAWHALLHRGLQTVKCEFEPKTWSAFWRVVVDGRTPDEAALELQTTSAAVRQSKSRVLRRLRAVLDGLVD
jgi:RNA polymerase sigma-70 factor (ECF subfamily)